MDDVVNDFQILIWNTLQQDAAVFLGKFLNTNGRKQSSAVKLFQNISASNKIHSFVLIIEIVAKVIFLPSLDA